MIETKLRFRERAFQHAEIDDHAGLRIGFAAHDHLGAVGMSVNAAVHFAIDGMGKRVGQFKSELLAEFEHHGIPTNLCICTLSRQRGCERQYAIAAAVFALRSGPSMGCSQK